jgi:ribosomal 50S subunit-recycling heat shock protein
MLRTGKIKVNAKKKDQTYKIEEGDEITFWMSDDEITTLQAKDEKWKIENLENKDPTKHWIW